MRISVIVLVFLASLASGQPLQLTPDQASAGVALVRPAMERIHPMLLNPLAGDPA